MEKAWSCGLGICRIPREDGDGQWAQKWGTVEPGKEVTLACGDQGKGRRALGSGKTGIPGACCCELAMNEQNRGRNSRA